MPIIKSGFVGSQFLPIRISDLTFWIASDRSPKTFNGSYISQIDDLSGNGNHAVQPSSSLQPLYSGLINNLRVYSPTPSKHVYVSGDIGLTQPFEMFIIVKCLDNNTGQMLVDTYNTTTDRVYAFNDTSGNTITAYSGSGTMGSSHTVGTANIYHLVFDSPNSRGFINTVEFDTSDVDTGSNDSTPGLRICCRYIPSSGLNGNVCEYVIFNKLLSASERNKNVQYYATKWGITI